MPPVCGRRDSGKIPPAALAAAAVRLAAVRLAAMRLAAMRLAAVRLAAMRLAAMRLAAVRRAAARLATAAGRAVRLAAMRLAAMRLAAVRRAAVRLAAVRRAAARLATAALAVLLATALAAGGAPRAQPADCATRPADEPALPLGIDLAGRPGVPSGVTGQAYVTLPLQAPSSDCGEPSLPADILHGEPGNLLRGNTPARGPR
jgi:hypothetical protein